MGASDTRFMSDYMAAVPVPTPREERLASAESFCSSAALYAEYEALDVFNQMITAGTITEPEVNTYESEIRADLVTEGYTTTVTIATSAEAGFTTKELSIFW